MAPRVPKKQRKLLSWERIPGPVGSIWIRRTAHDNEIAVEMYNSTDWNVRPPGEAQDDERRGSGGKGDADICAFACGYWWEWGDAGKPVDNRRERWWEHEMGYHKPRWHAILPWEPKSLCGMAEESDHAQTYAEARGTRCGKCKQMAENRLKARIAREC